MLILAGILALADQIARTLEYRPVRVAQFVLVEAWMTRNAGEMTAWVLFLVGLFLASDAVQALTGN